MPGMKSERAPVVRQPVSDAPMNARRYHVADMIALCHVKLQYLTWLAGLPTSVTDSTRKACTESVRGPPGFRP